MAFPIIMCVDDDVTALKAMRTFLVKALGDENLVEVAESGQEALDICDDLARDARELSVVIADFIMPGMRGDDFLLKLHERSPRTVNIMLTGQSDLEGVKRAINEANLYRFLEKPYRHEDLALAVKTSLQTYQMQVSLEQENFRLQDENAAFEIELSKQQALLAQINSELSTQATTGNANKL